jgi:hypothetical protein
LEAQEFVPHASTSDFPANSISQEFVSQPANTNFSIPTGYPYIPAIQPIFVPQASFFNTPNGFMSQFIPQVQPIFVPQATYPAQFVSPQMLPYGYTYSHPMW